MIESSRKHPVDKFQLRVGWSLDNKIDVARGYGTAVVREARSEGFYLDS